MPKVTVDGQEIEAPAGATVMQTICALVDSAALLFQGRIRHFRSEMERRINERAGGEMLEAAE